MLGNLNNLDEKKKTLIIIIVLKKYFEYFPNHTNNKTENNFDDDILNDKENYLSISLHTTTHTLNSFSSLHSNIKLIIIAIFFNKNIQQVFFFYLFFYFIFKFFLNHRNHQF
jgi:hypothetical protein